MSFFDKIMNKLGMGDDYDDEKDLMDERFERMSAKPVTVPSSYKDHDNIISFQAASAAARGDTAALLKMKVVVIEPKTFDDSQQIANYLKDKKPVVVNFENTDSDVAMRIIDFISGTTYALSGEIKKVSHHVFLCAPSNVNVAYTQENGSIQTELPWMKK